jgi:protein O-GlcNAc transferase
MQTKTWFVGVASATLAALLLAFVFGWLGPFRAEAARKRGLDLSSQGRWNEARIQLDQALALRDDDAAAHQARARVLIRLHRDDDALADLRQARRIEPKNELFRAEEIDLLTSLGRNDEALSLVAEAQRDLVVPGLEIGLASARARAAADNLHEAVAELEALIEVHPESHRAHHLKGKLCRRLGEELRAREAFAAAVTLAPGIARYRRALQERTALPR